LKRKIKLLNFIKVVTLLLLALSLSGCIQKSVLVQEQYVTFTFDVNKDEDFKNYVKSHKLEYAQLVGSFNGWEVSNKMWHYYGFNDRGIYPDEKKGDGIWTCKVKLPYGPNYYMIALNGETDIESSTHVLYDPNNPNKGQDFNSGSDRKFSLLWIPTQ